MGKECQELGAEEGDGASNGDAKVKLIDTIFLMQFRSNQAEQAYRDYGQNDEEVEEERHQSCHSPQQSFLAAS